MRSRPVIVAHPLDFSQGRRPRIRLDQPLLDRERGQGGRIVQIQFSHQVGAMLLDRLDAEAQVFGDDAVGAAFRDQLEHLALAMRDRAPDRGDARAVAKAEIAVDDLAGNIRAEVLPLRTLRTATRSSSFEASLRMYPSAPARRLS